MTEEKQTSLVWKIKCILGGTRLGHSYYLFLLVHTLFLVFTKIPWIFINTLLMKQTGEVNSTLFYNGAIFAACAVTMLFSARLMSRTESRLMVIIGIIGYNILYLCYVLFQSHVGEYYQLFGLFNGMADGFYYIGYGSMILEFTTVENRDSGMGIISIFSAVVNLAVPFLSGCIITAIGGVRGYAAIFVIAFVIALASLLAVFRLPRDTGREQKAVDYRRFIRIMGKNRQILYGLLGETLKGTREGAFMFILNVILYQLIKREFLIGCNALITGLASIISFWFISHWFRPHNRRKFMAVSAVVLTAASLVCMEVLNPVSIMCFSVINGLFAGMIEVSCYTTFFDVSQKVVKRENCSPELLAFHEVFVVTGRCLGLGIFACINTAAGASLKAQMFSLFLLTLIQFATIAMCRLAWKTEVSAE